MSSGNIVQSILAVVLLFVGMWMAFLVYRADKKSKDNIYLSALITIGVAFILLDYTAIFVDTSLSLLVERIAYGLAPIALFTLYLFTLHFPENARQNIFIKYSIMVYAVFFSFLSMFSNQIILSIKKSSWGVEINGGGFELFYNLFAILVVGAILYTSLIRYNKLAKTEKKKVKLFFLGMSIFIASEAVSVALLPIFRLDRFSYFGD